MSENLDLSEAPDPSRTTSHTEAQSSLSTHVGSPYSRNQSLLQSGRRARNMENQNSRERADIHRMVLHLQERQLLQLQEMNRLHDRASATANSLPVYAQAPSSSIRSRPRATPGSSHLQRHRLRQAEEDSISERLGTVQDAIDRISETNAHLRSVLEGTLPRIVMDSETMGADPGDGETYRRRSKRRKLDTDPLSPAHGFKYGHHGQVVPGRLKMSIESCDGGELHIQGAHLRYPPENILRNDKSVYCTERVKCNIILKHWGDTAFSLTKLVIKAPDSCFTAPVQDGLVFISMTLNGLLARTSHYNFQPHKVQSPSPRFLEPPLIRQRTRGGFLPFTSTRDYNDNRPPSRRSAFPSNESFRALAAEVRRQRDRAEPEEAASLISTSPLHPSDHDFADWRQMFPASNADESDSPRSPPFATPSSPLADPPPHQTSATINTIPPTAGFSPPPPRIPTPPPFNVTMSCDPLSGDDEEESPPDVLFDRQQRQAHPPSSSDDDEQPIRDRVRRLRSSSRRLEWTPTRDGERPQSDCLEPHAVFFIHRRKHFVTIKFDPPVTGRYILLKLFSPVEGHNIDVQSVSAYGFGGPRFFPVAKTL